MFITAQIIQISMQSFNIIAPNSLEYQHDLNSFDHKEEYLRKTIEVKNKNIDELLKQLRETKELYQEYKAQYIAQQKRMKTKLLELSNKLDLQATQLQKHKLLVSKLRSDYQTNQQKEKKSGQTYITQLRQLGLAKNELQDKMRGVLRQNSQLKERNDSLVEKIAKVEEKCKTSQKQLSQCQQELANAKQEMKQKSFEWQSERNRLLNQIQEMNERKKQKSKVNQKLQAIENKIINTLRKI